MPLNMTGQNALLAGGLAAAATHVGVAVLADPGTGTNANAVEANGGGYTRLPVTWSAPAAGAITNTTPLEFAVPAGVFGFFLLFNAAVGNVGSYLGHLPFQGTVEGVGTTDAVRNRVLSAAHGLVGGDRVMVYTTFAESLPSGLTEGVIYHAVGVTADEFGLALTPSGASVDIGPGEVYFQRLVQEPFAAAGTLRVAAGQLTISTATI